MANEIEIVVSATNRAAQTLSEAAAAARADGEAAGTAFAEGVDAGASKLEGAGAGMEKLGASMAAQGAADGEKAGAELANGVVAGTSSLEERMRAGYDKVLASWQEGTAGFVDAQLQTFADFYGRLAALGDESAAAQLAAIQALAGGTEAAVAEMTVSVASAVDRMNADLEAAMSRGGASSGAAFVQGLDESLSGISLSQQGVAGAVTEMSVEATAAGVRAGDAFAVSFSAASEAALMSSTVTGITSQAFNMVPQITPAQTAAVHSLGAEYSSVGTALSEVSNKTVPVGTSLKDLSGSADGATRSMGGLASVMYGPLGYAAFGLMSFLPMLSGMFTTSAVSASAFTASVQQDSFAVGDNTAATIQQSLAKSGLNDISQALGVSQATLIEYAAGEKQAQDAVTAAYNAKQSSLQQASSSEGIHSKAQADAGNAADQEANALANKKAELDQVTQAVQQAIEQDTANSAALLAAEQSTQIYNAAVNSLGQTMLLNVQQTQMSNEATLEYGDRLMAAESSVQFMNAAVGAAGVNLELQAHATQITNEATVQYLGQLTAIANENGAFNDALDASYAKLQLQSQASAQATTGLLDLGDSQARANTLTYDSLVAYTQAAQGASAYGSALTALNGSEATLLGSEASFTTSLNALTTSMKTNGESLDVNTAKGAANVQALVAIANAADKAAVAVYQNELNTKGSTQAYEDANAKLAQEKTAFENQAIAAGESKDKVKALADELFQLPPSVDIPINANPAPALNSLAQVINRINTSSGTVTIYENSSGTVFSSGGGNKAYATGGITAAAVGGPRDGWVRMNEQGQEFARLPTGTTVIPHANAESMLAAPGGGGVQRLEVEWVGGNQGDALLTWLRSAIRFRGGNVQKVLGVN